MDNNLEQQISEVEFSLWQCMTFVQMSQVQKQKQDNDETVELVIEQLTCFSSHTPDLFLIALPFPKPLDPNDKFTLVLLSVVTRRNSKSAAQALQKYIMHKSLSNTFQ